MGWRMSFSHKISQFFTEASLNVLLLHRTMQDLDVHQDTIDSVTADLQELVKTEKLNEGMIASVFEKHDISDLAQNTFDELERDPPCLSYGHIGCF